MKQSLTRPMDAQHWNRCTVQPPCSSYPMLASSERAASTQVTGTETRVQERRGLRLLVLAPNPEISGPFPGPIARIAYSLVDALEGAGCIVEPELWGRHEAH